MFEKPLFWSFSCDINKWLQQNLPRTTRCSGLHVQFLVLFPTSQYLRWPPELSSTLSGFYVCGGRPKQYRGGILRHQTIKHNCNFISETCKCPLLALLARQGPGFNRFRFFHWIGLLNFLTRSFVVCSVMSLVAPGYYEVNAPCSTVFKNRKLKL